MCRRGAVLAWAVAATLLAASVSCVGAASVLRGAPQAATPSAGGNALPSLVFRFASFATPDPQAAGAFLVKYLGGQLLKDRQDWLTHQDAGPQASVVGLRFPYDEGRRSTDLYFINDPSKPVGHLTVERYAAYLHQTHRFDIQETWDWYQDWHYCFYTEDLDLLLYRLLRDGVPVVTRSSYSFYVEIPGTGLTLQFLGKKMDLIWTENFNFCRNTTGSQLPPPQPMQLAALPKELPPLPELRPSHQSFFSNQPGKVQDFLTLFTSGKSVDMQWAWKESHRYSDGRCAMLNWIEFDEPDHTRCHKGAPMYDGFWQAHMVQQYRKSEGEGLLTKQVEDYLMQLHGNMTRKDAFMDFRTGFQVESLEPFQSRLDAHGVPYLLETYPARASLWMQLPGGIVFELFTSKQQQALGSHRPAWSYT